MSPFYCNVCTNTGVTLVKSIKCMSQSLSSPNPTFKLGGYNDWTYSGGSSIEIHSTVAQGSLLHGRVCVLERGRDLREWDKSPKNYLLASICCIQMSQELQLSQDLCTYTAFAMVALMLPTKCRIPLRIPFEIIFVYAWSTNAGILVNWH